MMTKVTINPKASAEVKEKARANEFTVTDATGREITLKKPGPLANLDFAKAAGSEKFNLLYLAEVGHLKYVNKIDGAPVPVPSTEGELRALYQRLGDEGNEAAQLGVAANFSPRKEARSEEEEVKNS
jgi:hypothetical protein